jgi:hypothetical protein
MTHPKDMTPIFLPPGKIAIIRGQGHFYAGTRAQGRKVLLGNPDRHQGMGEIGWTKPTYYAYGYQAIFNTLGAFWTIQERYFDPDTGAQIGGVRDRTISTLQAGPDGQPSHIVDRPPGTYISIHNPYPDDVLIDADKDFDGGGGNT